MSASDLAAAIEVAWERRETLTAETRGSLRDAVAAALEGLDSGRLWVAEKLGGEWHVHQWLKKAVLLSFRMNGMRLVEGGPGGAHWWDKVEIKFAGWDEARFR